MSNPSFHYRPEIDGLRAIAILSVLLFHAGISPLKGGFLGVDIFFVISGYLITSIIHAELQEGRFSFQRFYLRRARRLFPALFLICAVTTVAAFLLFTPDYLADYGLSLASTVFYLSNFHLWQAAADYFGNATEFWPLLHSWSLAIEEQYYIFWPLLLWAAVRGGGRRLALLFALVLGFTSFATYYLLAADNETLAAFYLLPARAWELMVGCALALGVIPAVRKKWLAQLLSLTGLILICGTVLWFYLASPKELVGMALVCLGTALIIHASATQVNWVSKLLSYRLLVSIGLVSYSLYLWHWPVLALAHYYSIWTLKWYETIFAVQFSIVLAALSWQYIEQPFRQRRDGIFSDRGLVVLTVVASVSLAGIGIFAWSKGGAFGPEGQLVNRFAATQPEVNPLRKSCNLKPRETAIPPVEGCLAGAPSPEKEYQVLVWGDSNADHYVPALAAVARANNLTLRQITMDGCQPVLFEGKNPYNGDCGNFNDAVRDIIDETDTLKLVILGGAWTNILILADHPPEGSKKFMSADLKASLLRTTAWLKSKGIKVLLLGQVPIFNHWKDMTICSNFAMRRRDFSECAISKAATIEKHAISNRILTEVAEKGGAYFFLPIDALCPTEQCLVYDDSGLFYRDSFHLNLHGSLKLVKPLSDFWPVLGIGK